MSLPPPGWYPDPHSSVGRVRYWNGQTWTAQWATPSPRQPVAKAPHPTLPLPVAVGAFASVVAPLVAGRYVLQWLAEFRWPIAVYVVLMGIVGYGPPIAFWRWASRRWGSGDPRADVGLSARWADVGWGPLTWLSCVVAQVMVAAIVLAADIPFESNTEGVSDLRGDRGYVIALLVLAVIAAPVVEEIVFRGLVLRGLRSALPAWLAVGTQGVLFGVVHYDPARGAGNIGLMMILGAAGVVLGGACYLLRRLAPSMIAHAIINSIAMTVALVRG